MLTVSQKQHGLLGTARQQVGVVAKESPFYHWMLSKGTPPSGLKIKLSDPWPGQADIGRMMIHGVFVQHGMSLKIDSEFWDKVQSQPVWQDIIHSFTWLRDLRAMGGDTARKFAREMVTDWLDKFDRWDSTVWRPDIIGQRLMMWISYYDFFCGSADEHFQRRYFASLSRQAKHLARSLTSDLAGIPLLKAAEGLVYAGLAISKEDEWALKGFEIILRGIPKQIKKDGSHASGNPESILDCARILLNLRYALNTANLPVPKLIDDNLQRMGTALRYFIYPDHKLALFHGGQESDSRVIDTTLAQIRQSKRPSKADIIGGFEKVSQGRAVLMIDTSTIPEEPFTKSYHSAPMAFEFIYGRDRIFTNCGGHPFLPDWKQVLRQTAAHNTLSLFDKSIHNFTKEGRLYKSHSPICSVRRESKNTCLIDMSHDAYRAGHGIDHQRRFFLSKEGTDLRGEDKLLSRVPLTKPAPVTVRFHLHPRVQITHCDDNGDIFMTLPSGTSWRFCAVGADTRLDESIYLGQGLKPVKSRQIVLESAMNGDEHIIKWALQRV